MKKALTYFTLFFASVIILTSAVFINKERSIDQDERAAEQIIALNEFSHLKDSGETELAEKKEKELRESIRSEDVSAIKQDHIFALAGISLAALLMMTTGIYLFIVKPFGKMEEYAGKIARGEFDTPIPRERGDFFGRYTWAFDSMRRELKRARDSEREAVENNKTVIATLSHDIKTPVASIKAYAEGLEAGMDRTPEQRSKFISVITRKCDEVAKLTDDLFIHSLSDMERLKVNPEKVAIREFLDEAVDEISAACGDISYKSPWDECYIYADRGRLMQVIENIVNNARKYAGTDISISTFADQDYFTISFRDKGSGIPDEDMPFIFGKFYRGRNCGEHPGSGLGLYIVKYLVEKMGGTVSLRNHPDGLEVAVCLRKAE
ncbi:MAG: HAMP domain-containing histidine kinase [Ruminococcus sp.]|nr:HAMP domain-containing histidine kinase [Ruminococcus sp.]